VNEFINSNVSCLNRNQGLILLSVLNFISSNNAVNDGYTNGFEKNLSGIIPGFSEAAYIL